MRRLLPLLLVAAAAATVAGCAQRVIRAPHGMPPPMSLRAAFDALPGDAGASTVVPLRDNAAAWAARWQLIAEARETIDASYFIIDGDAFGLALLGHLYERALAGVKVRLLVDGRGTLPLLGADGRDLLQEMVGTGNIEIGIYNPALSSSAVGLLAGNAGAALASSHDKILVVDSRRAIVGGRNIAASYYANPAVDPTATIDADVILDEGPARALQAKLLSELTGCRMIAAEAVNVVSRRDELLLYRAAMDAWLRMPRDDPRAGVEAALAVEGAAMSSFAKLPPRDVRDRVRFAIHELVRDHQLRGTVPFMPAASFDGDVHVLGATSRARGFDYRINGALLQAFAGAQREIVFETPYFILTRPALAALEELGRRGVRITVVTNSPSSSDNAVSQALFVDEWPELMARVPTLRVLVLDGARLLHAKRVVIDDELTLVGTYNLDPLSARVNSEVIAAVWSEPFTRATRAEIDELSRSPSVIEYRIARDEQGRALRHPKGHPRAGRVVIAYGPEHHVAPEVLADLRTLKAIVVGTAGFFDFEVAVW